MKYKLMIARWSVLALVASVGLGITGTTATTALAQAAEALEPAVSEADQWIEKSVRFYFDNAPYELDFTMDMAMSMQGMDISADARAKLLYAAADRMRMNMDMQMKMPMLEEPMTMKMLSVANDTGMWMEMQNSMMGDQKQVIKMNPSDIKDMQQQMGLGGMNMPGGQAMDPGSMIEAYKEFLELSVGSVGGGKVVLQGKMKDSFMETLGESAAMFGDAFQNIAITLDEATGQMESMTMGDPEAPMMTMKYSSFKKLNAEAVGDETFAYTPPEGVTVQDLSEAMHEVDNAEP